MTYRQLLESAQKDARNGNSMAVANLLAVRELMANAQPDAQVDQAQLAQRMGEIMNSRSFKLLMQDQETKGLCEEGNFAEVQARKKEFEDQTLTYWKYMRALKEEANVENPAHATAATMIVTTMLMADGAHEPVNNNLVAEQTAKMMKQPAFKEIMQDPAAIDALKQGENIKLVRMLADKQYEMDHALDGYKRGTAQLEDDKKVLADYMKSVAGTAYAGAVQLEGKDPKFREVVKQVEQAQQLMDQGIPLTGEQGKALADAVRKYNNNGSKKAGGSTYQNAHYVQNMSLLRHFSPVKEYNQYCRDIAKNHPKYETLGENFVPGRLNGTVQTAKELEKKAKEDLQRNASEENIAKLCAIQALSKGDPFVTISNDQLRAETNKLVASGTAFRRVVTNKQDRLALQDLAKKGDTRNLIKEVNERSKMHAIGSAQWRLNRAESLLQQGNLNHYNTAECLATIIAANKVASKAKDLSQVTTNKAFASEVESVKKDKAFVNLVDKYEHDPVFRKKMNATMEKQNDGKALVDELNLAAHPKKAREAYQAQLQAAKA